MTAKQNAINTATHNIQNTNDKTESDTPDKRKLPVTVIHGDSMVKGNVNPYWHSCGETF